MEGDIMKANYVDIIMKYMTWYKDITVRIENETTYNLPIMYIHDDKLNNDYPVYFVESILSTFKLIGLDRALTK